jgi:hypothetical protein
MKKTLSLLSLTICFFLVSCGYKSEQIPAMYTDTSIPLRVPTSISIVTPIETLNPVSTASLYFPPYQTKQFILNYCVSGWHGSFDMFTDKSCWPLLVLYTDGQMIIPGETYHQKFLSEEEIVHLLMQLESKGLYTLETNQKHDPTDHLYDFGDHYERIYDGLYYCIVVRNVTRERNLCVHDPQREYLIPEMRNLLEFLDEYQLDEATQYYPDRILLSVEAGRNPYVQNLPEQAIPWPEHLPPLETAGYNPIYAEGKMALEIYALFDNTDSFRVFTQDGREYTLEIEPVLPHEELIIP